MQSCYRYITALYSDCTDEARKVTIALLFYVTVTAAPALM